MKRTLCASACLAMLLASCGGLTEAFRASTTVSGIRENAPSWSYAARELQDENEPEDADPATEPDAAAIGRATVARTRTARQAAALRRLVGGSLPVETAAEQDRREREMYPRLDSLLNTAMHIDGHRAELQDYSSSVRCSGPSCTHTFPDGETLTYDLSSPPTSVVSTSLLTRNGITIQTKNDAFVTDSGRSMHVGAIMSTLHNSDFGSGYQYRSETADYYGDSIRWSISAGDLTGSRPSVIATWRGMATAVTKQNDDLLLGDAELRYSFSASGGSLEATLGAFVNVTEARATTPLAIFFDDIQVRSDGTFNFRGSTNRKFQGAFYGNAHAEAAGVFEGSIPDGSGNLLDLLGAFGTKRAN